MLNDIYPPICSLYANPKIMKLLYTLTYHLTHSQIRKKNYSHKSCQLFIANKFLYLFFNEKHKKVIFYSVLHVYKLSHINQNISLTSEYRY
jgi:hypothetical protein